MPWIVLILTLLAAPFGWAADPVSPALQELIEEVRTSLDPAQACAPVDEPKPSCAKLAQDHCEALSADTSADKSQTSSERRMDLQALADSLPRLPSDLQEKSKAPLSILKALLDAETDTETWYDVVNRAESQFDETVQELAKERTYRKHPDWKEIKDEDRTLEQIGEFKADLLDLENQVVTAKYENHPNWKRVVWLFGEAKKLLVEDIQTWRIPESERQRLRKKVESVQLRLPFKDPRVLTDGENYPSCPTTEANALYFHEHNALTVCAGLFNTRANASLIWTLGHELGHAIDPTNQASDRLMNSPVGKVIDRLCNAAGPAFPCGEWNGIKKTVLAVPEALPEPKTSIGKLTSCLRPEGGLKPFRVEALKAAAAASVTAEMDFRSQKMDFSDLSKPPKDGAGGIYFLRPDRVRAYHKGGLSYTRNCDAWASVSSEILTQELSCFGYTGSESNRAAQLEQALENTESVMESLELHWYAQCGRDCPGLAPYRIGRSTDEDVADWMGTRVLSRFLAAQPPIAQRKFLAMSASDFCDLKPDDDLRIAERRWTSKTHPANKLRFMRILVGAGPAAGCIVDEELRKVAPKCDF